MLEVNFLLQTQKNACNVHAQKLVENVNYWSLSQ